MPDQESKGERLDRELGELLQGLRVLLPGVQVLFAFLLTVPFSQRFTQLNSSEQALFVSTLICTALASALLAAPSAFHRVLFRDREKEWLIVQSNRLTLAGTFFLAGAIVQALFLVVEVVYDTRVATYVAVGAGVILATLWYVVPLVRRAKN